MIYVQHRNQQINQWCSTQPQYSPDSAQGTQTQTQTYRDTDRQTQTQTDRQIQTQTQTDRDMMTINTCCIHVRRQITKHHPICTSDSKMKYSDTNVSKQTSDLDAELPLASNLYARNWSKVIWRHQSALFGTTHTRHTLDRPTHTPYIHTLHRVTHTDPTYIPYIESHNNPTTQFTKHLHRTS